MKKVIAIILFFCAGLAIFYYIKQPDTGFNIIPYAFFMLFNSNANSGGEHSFIVFFDLLFSMSIVFLLCKMFYQKKQ